MKMNRKVILPQLVGKTMTDQWYVEFSVFDESEGKMVRFRKSKGFAALKTIQERRAYGIKQVVRWEAKLRDLKYNPFENNVVVITDTIEYRVNPKRVKHSEYNLSYFLNAYFKEKHGELRPKTINTYKAKARILLTWLENRQLHDYHPKYLSMPMIKAFSEYLVLNRQVHNRTFNAYVQTFSTIWEFMISKNVAEQNVWKGISKKRFQSKSQRPFSPEQSERIVQFLGKVNPWLLFYCEFQYHTLIRPCSEQPQIRVSDIDFHAHELIVRGEISKNKKTQRVAIPDQLMARVTEFQIQNSPGDYFVFGKYGPSPTPVGKDYFSKMFREVLTKLKIGKDWSMYSWKHTMNQRAAMQGIPVKELQIQNRHHSLDQMDAYLKGLTVRDAKNLFDNIPKM
jgi:integrase